MPVVISPGLTNGNVADRSLTPTSIGGRLVAAAVLCVVVPFLALTVWLHSEMKERVSGDIVRYFLKSKAADVADKIDLLVVEQVRAARGAAADPAVARAMGAGDALALEQAVRASSARSVEGTVILAADRTGRILASSGAVPEGLDAALEPWWGDVMEGREARSDRQDSRLEATESQFVTFAQPVHLGGTVAGVWIRLMPWASVQEGILDPVRSEYFARLLTGGGDEPPYASGYAGLIGADGDTILGHMDRSLYGARMGDMGLGFLRDAVQAEEWGVLHYEFPEGVGKHAGWRRTAASEAGGFGWTVGIGINDDDIFRTVHVLGNWLIGVSALMLGALAGGAFLLSRTITRPLGALASAATEFGRGAHGVRVEGCTDDEIGHLGRSFNAMADEIETARDSELSAERDAAWREMARQVAHEIKNPLTPMALSVHMIRKARRDGSERLEEVLDQSIHALASQIEALKAIADDFSAVAGSSRSALEEVDLAALCADLKGLYAGLAKEREAEISWDSAAVTVEARTLDMRRLLINLVDNACAAVGQGGRIAVRVAGAGAEVVIEVEDNGPGLPEGHGDRLFDPEFSTKTGGAGLGLVICRRIVEDLGGTITLANGAAGGAVAEVRLPAV